MEDQERIRAKKRGPQGYLIDFFFSPISSQSASAIGIGRAANPSPRWWRSVDAHISTLFLNHEVGDGLIPVLVLKP